MDFFRYNQAVLQQPQVKLMAAKPQLLRAVVVQDSNHIRAKARDSLQDTGGTRWDESETDKCAAS